MDEDKILKMYINLFEDNINRFIKDYELIDSDLINAVFALLIIQTLKKPKKEFEKQTNLLLEYKIFSLVMAKYILDILNDEETAEELGIATENIDLYKKYIYVTLEKTLTTNKENEILSSFRYNSLSSSSLYSSSSNDKETVIREFTVGSGRRIIQNTKKEFTENIFKDKVDLNEVVSDYAEAFREPLISFIEAKTTYDSDTNSASCSLSEENIQEAFEEFLLFMLYWSVENNGSQEHKEYLRRQTEDKKWVNFTEFFQLFINQKYKKYDVQYQPGLKKTM